MKFVVMNRCYAYVEKHIYATMLAGYSPFLIMSILNMSSLGGAVS